MPSGLLAIAGMDRLAFEQNESARDAVERCIERIYEASHRLGGRTEELMPSQAWGDIRGMGNRLRHAYDRIDIDIIGKRSRRACTNLGGKPLTRSLQPARALGGRVSFPRHDLTIVYIVLFPTRPV